MARTVTAVAAARAARRMGRPAFITVLDEEHVQTLEDLAVEGPLSGVPFAVKDNIDVAGVASTAACPTLTAPAARSAMCVQRLAEAGGVPIGKTNMDQFATGLVGTRTPYGACSSVFSAAHISGGSSSGSALAVASGVVPLALGTDTAGSGRVPAAFNGLVGMKPTRGLVSVRGVRPACPSLDCVTTFTRTVAEARTAFDVLAAPDPQDPFSRTMPAAAPNGVAQRMTVVGVPSGHLDLDDAHRQAWQRFLTDMGGAVGGAVGGLAAAPHHAPELVRLVPVDVSALLAAAGLLYEKAFVAERYAAFGHLLEPDGPHLDPVVRRMVLAGRDATAVDVFAARQRLAVLAHAVASVFAGVDAVLLPVTPGHPTQAEVAAEPVLVNARLGTYTNMVNLVDLCAIALPAGFRADGLPFGVQLLAPAFADRPLLDLAERVCGERTAQPGLPADRVLLAVSGAHLSGQPLNAQLVALGGRLHARARTGGGYRMYYLPGPVPRPGLVDTGDGPADGLEVELWKLPHHGLGQLLTRVGPPLRLGPVRLDDGTTIVGFLADPAASGVARDITGAGGWRAYLASRPNQPVS